MDVIQEIFRIFAERGESAYFGEPVSQQEHALQAAVMARQSGASNALCVAALLHDMGHLIHGESETIADEGIDARHEAAGQAWLSKWFGPEVTEPVRLHVDAKRYLCRVEPEYLAQLSPASVQSLALQGGPFSLAEAEKFESNAVFAGAVELRRWDDAAKIPGMKTSPLEDYRDALGAALRE